MLHQARTRSLKEGWQREDERRGEAEAKQRPAGCRNAGKLEDDVGKSWESPFVAETTAAALVPLVATLGSFVAKGTGYALGAFVTDKTATGLGAFVGEHARARAVPLVPAGGRHFFLVRHFFASLRFRPTRIVELRRRHF